MRVGTASCVFMLFTAADTSEVAGMLQLRKEDCSKGDCKPTLVPKICCKAMNAQCGSCSAGITEEEFCRINPKMAGCDAPRICCQAMNAQCESCKAGTTKEEFCRSNPKMAGCEAKDCSLVRCASEKSCTDKGGSFHQEAGQCCGLCEIKPKECVANNTNPCVHQICFEGEIMEAHEDCQRQMMGDASCKGHWEPAGPDQCCDRCVETKECVVNNTNPCVHQICFEGELMEAHLDCQRQMMGDASCKGHWEPAGPDQCCDRCVETKECVAINDPNKPCQRQECRNGELLITSMSCMSPDSCAVIKAGAVYTPPGIGECCGSCVDPPVVDNSNSTDCKVDNSSPCRREQCLEDGTKATMIVDCAFDCQDGNYVPPTPDQCCGSCETPECIVDTSNPCVTETCLPTGGKSVMMTACMPAEMCTGDYTAPTPDQCCGQCEEKKCIVDTSDPCRHEFCGEDGTKHIAVVDCFGCFGFEGAVLADPEPGQCCGMCQMP